VHSRDLMRPPQPLSATDAELLARSLRTDNASAARFVGMGFRMVRTTLQETKRGEMDYGSGDMTAFHTISLRSEIECVCGRRETFTLQALRTALFCGAINIYQEIERAGALERSHLVGEDGYTHQQVDEMESRLKEFLEGAHQLRERMR
jgi:hypothetical protein